jgi:hypothetical protein
MCVQPEKQLLGKSKQGPGVRSPLLVDIRDHGCVVRGYHYLETLNVRDPSLECIDNLVEL